MIGVDELSSRIRRKRRRKPVEERYWAKVIKHDEGCWGWTGPTHEFGYGCLGDGSDANRKIYAHRFSWELHFGSIPEGFGVFHRCDNPPCSNPDHLFIGPCIDNVHDMHEKGRARYGHLQGERQGSSKLTEDGARLILSGTWKNQGMTRVDLAQHLGVSKTVVAHVIQRRAWTHVEVPE